MLHGSFSSWPAHADRRSDAHAHVPSCVPLRPLPRCPAAPLPPGCGTSLLATDVLWSDPVAEPGFHENDARGVGLTFGPDMTEVRAGVAPEGVGG